VTTVTLVLLLFLSPAYGFANVSCLHINVLTLSKNT